MTSMWEMTWFDVVRMASNPISQNSFDEINFSPTKEVYEQYGGDVDTLRQGLINSFRAAEKKISVRKWVEREIGGVPEEMLEFQKGGNRWDTNYIMVEEEIEEEEEEEEESLSEENNLEEEDSEE